MATTKNQQRVNFSRMQKHMPYPDFLEIQLKSFQDFLQMDSTPEQRRKEGLFKVFSENFPIQDTRSPLHDRRVYQARSDLFGSPEGQTTPVLRGSRS